jgi:hypothetical protein
MLERLESRCARRPIADSMIQGSGSSRHGYRGLWG